MKEVIQEILDEEKLARERIEAARTQARQDTETDRIVAQKSIETTRTAALQEAEQIQFKAKAEADLQKEQLIQAARAQQSAVLADNRTKIEAATERLFRAVTTGEKLTP